MSVLKVEELSKQFGGLIAVDNVSMHIESGELIGLIGPNGAGKTTLFNLLTGVYEPSAGDICFMVDEREKRLNGLKPFKITDCGIARTFQNIRLFSQMSVMENVLIAMHPHSGEGVFSSILRLPQFYRKEEKLREESLRLLDLFQLADKADQLAGSLAYGEQRCLEIVRALATKPKLLFLDEPAAGMNPKETNQLTQQISKIRSEFGISIILIEHDMSLVMEVCDRIYVLDYGKLIAEGEPEEIRTNPIVIKAYLGEEF
ncbi:ABC transporter ATP-binding protein [Culicoidibacter larvae]|uniref:ABC transporter ATP-binding protein n=1 Tax=Culicoidibacter larvae TaxID=2579976 RepID=A0A5R8QGK5_9FIRM|nr:ABC transporter ATP-binding protein [Culicoidibacter larvae]TLG77145.1 ABC transporter ATP-binding protein [Culicoidibacter larvae]